MTSRSGGGCSRPSRRAWKSSTRRGPTASGRAARLRTRSSRSQRSSIGATGSCPAPPPWE
eukprot:10355858-Lingulodinium_polyedra.AAC.1